MAHIETLPSGKIVLRDDWCADDILSIRPDLTEDEAEEVLGFAAKQHDCNIGITWDVLETHADWLYPEDDEEA